MKLKNSPARKTFLVFDTVFLSVAALLCLFPVLHVLSLSFSSALAASAGSVVMWPVDFTLDSYRYVAAREEFWRAFGVSLQRIGLALPLTLFVTVISAYPMSKSKEEFKLRPFYTYFLLIPMCFSGGLIPWFLVLKQIGLTNSLPSLVIPGLVQIFNIILMMNFMRDMPAEIEEAAKMDGAGPLLVLFRIIVPLMLPSIATIALFIMVGHWNDWFNGIILMDTPTKYPLQSYLQTIISPTANLLTMDTKNLDLLKKINDRTFRAAQIFLAMVPILMVYPFLQKYFTKGLVLGSVKG